MCLAYYFPDVPDMVNRTLVTNSVMNLLRVVLTWLSPNDNNSPITMYNISYCELGGDITSQCVMPDILLPARCNFSLSIMATAVCEFPVNSNLSVQILAVNSVGMGPALNPPVTLSTATPGELKGV